MKSKLFIQIALLQPFVKLFKGDAENYVQRIDHIPQGFAHFAAMRVTDHCVQENLKKYYFNFSLNPH